jgi:hypothetical protein
LLLNSEASRESPASAIGSTCGKQIAGPSTVCSEHCSLFGSQEKSGASS